MKRLIPLIFLSILLIGCTNRKLPYVQDLIPRSKSELEQQLAAFDAQAEKGLADFISLSQSQSYDEAYLAWNRLFKEYFALRGLFHNGKHFALNPSLKSDTEQANTALVERFQEKLSQNEALMRAFIVNGLASSRLSPQQRWMTESILREYSPLFPQAKPQIDLAIKQLQKEEQTNFSIANSRTPSASEMQNLSILTANIDAFPGLLSYFYGGTSPWPNRIDAMAQKIEEIDAHIVCLQEVWDNDLMAELIQRLSGRYSVFVYDAGNGFATLSPEQIGLSSALFIASKVPLNHVEYAHFDHSYAVVGNSKKGAILATCQVNGAPFSFVATHLQFGNNPEMMAIRKEQLQECVDRLQSGFQMSGSEIGCILGDLNINAFTDEFFSLQMAGRFEMPYLANQAAVTLDNQTCTNYFNDLVETAYDKRSAVVPTYELLDYCLWPIETASIGAVTQKRIDLFDVKKPTKAISDHHGILTIFELK